MRVNSRAGCGHDLRAGAERQRRIAAPFPVCDPRIRLAVDAARRPTHSASKARTRPTAMRRSGGNTRSALPMRRALASTARAMRPTNSRMYPQVLGRVSGGCVRRRPPSAPGGPTRLRPIYVRRLSPSKENEPFIKFSARRSRRRSQANIFAPPGVFYSTRARHARMCVFRLPSTCRSRTAASIWDIGSSDTQQRFVYRRERRIGSAQVRCRACSMVAHRRRAAGAILWQGLCRSRLGPSPHRFPRASSGSIAKVPGDSAGSFRGPPSFHQHRPRIVARMIATLFPRGRAAQAAVAQRSLQQPPQRFMGSVQAPVGVRWTTKMRREGG